MGVLIAIVCVVIGIAAWKKAKPFSVLIMIIGVLGGILYYETGPGSKDDEDDDDYYEEYYEENEDDDSYGGPNPSFRSSPSNIKGKCKFCDDCYQYDGLYQGYWPNCSCGHSYAGHKTK